jgi:anti-anti-sigma factor
MFTTMTAGAVRNGNAMNETSIYPTTDVFALAGCRQDPAWVITVSGELDISCVHILRDGFTRAAKESCERVVVDASGVTFIDCGGLRALLDATAACSAEVWLRSPSLPMLGLAGLVGLGREWRGAMRGDEVRIA